MKVFMRTAGVPAFGLLMMRMLPVWKKLCGVAHTPTNDHAIVLEHQHGEPHPAGYLSGVTVPALVIAGGKSPAYQEGTGSGRCRAPGGNTP